MTDTMYFNFMVMYSTFSNCCCLRFHRFLQEHSHDYTGEVLSYVNTFEKWLNTDLARICVCRKEDIIVKDSTDDTNIFLQHTSYIIWTSGTHILLISNK